MPLVQGSLEEEPKPETRRARSSEGGEVLGFDEARVVQLDDVVEQVVAEDRPPGFGPRPELTPALCCASQPVCVPC